MPSTLFVSGGTGFIGREVVAEAVQAGWRVLALARSERSAAALETAGAEPVRGDATDNAWAREASGATVMIDLAQPELPKRLSRRAVRRVVERRLATTQAALDALSALPPRERPVYFAINGADDLQPDSSGTIDHQSSERPPDRGFAMIGIPVRRLVERSGLDAAYIHFGVMVYGHGKGFAEVYVDGLRKGRAVVIGSGENRLPLTHVTDAARALVHLAGLPREQLAGRTFLAADGSDTTQAELLDDTADLMGVKHARRVPRALAALVGGPVAVEAMTFDAHVDNSALRETGFDFRYPSHREGLPATLAALARD